MSGLVGYLVLFLLVGIGFVFVHLMIGKMVRPSKPSPEKQTIYECGEPTIGSAWIQFDLRFYVVALLFVIFDVEVAFFFPWAVVFGSANQLRTDNLSLEERIRITREVTGNRPADGGKLIALADRRDTLRDARNSPDADVAAIDAQLAKIDEQMPEAVAENRAGAQNYAWLAFWDILVFFGVLLVGFAYLWARGDLKWVRSLASEEGEPPAKAPGAAPKSTERVLVGSGS
jgi:NADH-quinone oxidoreductase subunit A